MRSLLSTICRIAIGSAIIIFLFGIACVPPERNILIDELYETEVNDVYMLMFRIPGAWQVNYYVDPFFIEDGQHTHRKSTRGIRESFLGRFVEPDDYPSNEAIIEQLEWRVPPTPIPNVTDSIGIYSKRTHELLAMFYSKKLEAEGKVSSTNYTNPFLAKHWELDVDDEEWAKRRWFVVVGSVTFVLRKIEE